MTTERRKSQRVHRESAICANKEGGAKDRRNAGFSMVELLVSVSLMSIMTAVLLQSFIVARRLNARASTEQRLQTLAQDTMESMRAADLTLAALRNAAGNSGTLAVDGVNYRVEKDGERLRLICNDIGNGRGPAVSFGVQYGVLCEFDPTPYSGRKRLIRRGGAEAVASFNSRAETGGKEADEKLVQLRVVVYRMEERLAKSGPEQLRLETARTISAGGMP